jgi:ATPase subunit of ABC transporter with duplicated ATPase domains
MIQHDLSQEFVKSVATELWVLEGRQVKRWEHGFEAYVDQLRKAVALSAVT